MMAMSAVICRADWLSSAVSRSREAVGEKIIVATATTARHAM